MFAYIFSISRKHLPSKVGTQLPRNFDSPMPLDPNWNAAVGIRILATRDKQIWLRVMGKGIRQQRVPTKDAVMKKG